ncbi:hypothetical protein [Flavobacterium akiainvivens]|nr:hypothetical protein [Flavobacterium akiainvivens]
MEINNKIESGLSHQVPGAKEGGGGDSGDKNSKSWHDFLKWFLGTFCIGVATIISTYIVKRYELREQTRAHESSYLKAYLDDYMTLVKQDTAYRQQYEMAKFLSFVVTDDDLKKGWTDLSLYCESKMLRLQHTKDSLQMLRDSLLGIKEEKVKEYYGLRNKQADSKEVPKLREKIDALTYQIDKNSKKAELISAKIDVPVAVTEVKPAAQAEILVNEETHYCTRNRYVEFNGSLRIFVNGFNKDSQSVNVSLLDVENEKFDEFEPERVLHLKEQITVSSPDGKYRYIITVQSLEFKNLGRDNVYFRVKTFKK